MTNKILVTYASKHGATAEIAKTIATVLGEYDLKVTLGLVDRVVDPGAYDAVILGSAVYASQWRPEAVKFLKRHADTLANRPVWLFSSGPTGAGDPEIVMQGWRYPEKLQPEIDHIAPREVVVFHGVIDPQTLNVFERFIIRRVQAPVGDYRDWVAISEWAMAIAEAMGAALSRTEETVVST